MIETALTVLHAVLLSLGSLTAMVLLGSVLGWLLHRAGPCWCEGGPSRCGTCVEDGDRLMEGEG